MCGGLGVYPAFSGICGSEGLEGCTGVGEGDFVSSSSRFRFDVG